MVEMALELVSVENLLGSSSAAMGLEVRLMASPDLQFPGISKFEWPSFHLVAMTP
jgi:hypothetical protein